MTERERYLLRLVVLCAVEIEPIRLAYVAEPKTWKQANDHCSEIMKDGRLFVSKNLEKQKKVVDLLHDHLYGGTVQMRVFWKSTMVVLTRIFRAVLPC